MSAPNELQVLETAHAALRAAVADLRDDERGLRTPCAQWTVAQVVEHAVLDQGIWAAAIGGAAVPDGDAFEPSGTRWIDVDEALRAAASAWRDAPDRVPSPLPQGELDLHTAVRAAAMDAAVHAWDVAVARGAVPALDDDLAAELLPAAKLLVEPLRQWGAFAPALTPAADETATGTLLRFLGRDPAWAAAQR